MKIALRILLFGLTIFYWVWLVKKTFDPLWIFLGVVVAIAACYPVVWIGRKLLDAKPTVERMEWVTTGVHFVLMFLLGTAIIVAIISAGSWRGWVLPIDPRVGWILVVITSLFTFLTVINLALRGLGAPFAVSLTRRLAADWLYAWTRNPMVLGTLACLVAVGLWLQSALFVVWDLIWVTPAWIAFLKVYEERELEIRLGEPYLEYRKRTPFLWPRRPQ